LKRSVDAIERWAQELFPEAGDSVTDRGVVGIAEVLDVVADHPVSGQLRDGRDLAAPLDKATLVVEDRHASWGSSSIGATPRLPVRNAYQISGPSPRRASSD
jgi:hypothetical protein